MLAHVDLKEVLFLDIETVSGTATYAELSPELQKLWELKSEQLQRRKEESEQLAPAEFYEKAAGIYAEFGKIVCISVGVMVADKETGELHLHLKSYYGDDEKKLLAEFADLIERRYNNINRQYLCGHNIREFDIPYICRRMVINGLELPNALDITGKKPWETKHFLDTLTLWKFGDYKAYTSLKLLCGVFGIPTPKEDIDGSEVGTTYWDENDLERIEVYCRKDVLATARLLLKYQLKELLPDSHVHSVEDKKEKSTENADSEEG